MEIRGECIKFATEIKKKEKSKELEIKHKIEILEESVENENQENELIELKEELKTIRERKLEGSLIRSRTRWTLEGEKPTKYFCSLENRNYIAKAIRSLVVDTRVVQDQKDIIKEVKSFYEKLYSSKDNELKNVNLETMLDMNTPRLNDDLAISLSGEVTIEEAYTVLKQFSNGKSPGTSGFPAEFYRTFWNELKFILVHAMNYSYQIDKLPSSLSEGIITCIPKPEKDRHYMKNWRPISLLNVSYKILSGVIARRIQKVLPFIISEDQTGFMKSRFIGDNLRLMYDTLNYANVHRKRGMLILIDFEKAFDSLSWKFLLNCLTYFNFPKELIKWIMLCYKDGKSAVNINAAISEWFLIRRGCRQGDPLSPYLFLICGEILALLIKQNSKIKGYNIEGTEIIISQYADDTSIFLQGDKESFIYCVQTILEYAKYSGLNMNFEKTHIIWFGPKAEDDQIFHEYPQFNWNPRSFKILGVEFTPSLENISDINIRKQIIPMENALKNWYHRNLTPFGKITVIKSLLNSKIVHILTSLPRPTEVVIKALESMFFKFLWNHKPDKIKRITVCQPKENGGLAMLNIRHFIQALHLTWIRRFYHNNPRWKLIVSNLWRGISKIHCYGSLYAQKMAIACDNQFWTDVFRSYEIYFDTIDKGSLPQNERIFMYSKNFSIDRKPIYYKQLENFNIFNIGQLKSNGEFMNYNEFRNIYPGIQLNFLNYISLIRILKTKVDNNYLEGRYTTAWSLLVKVNKGASHLYKAINTTSEMPSGVRKWKDSQFQSLDWQKVFSDLYNTTTDNKLIWFQYRILHNALTTNRTVSKFIPEQTDLCQFCKKSPEYITHLFFECETAYHFWNELRTLILKRCKDTDLELSKELIIMNTHQTNETVDAITKLIILLGKFHIYRCKVNDSKPCVKAFIKELEMIYKVEEISAQGKGLVGRTKLDLRWLKHRPLLQGLIPETHQ